MLLSPQGISELIEELANVRASMTVEQPTGIAPGWRFVITKTPIMATQKHANGDRLLILRHNGHGWVPFTFYVHAEHGHRAVRHADAEVIRLKAQEPS